MQRKAFERERDLYRDATLRAMMPATHAIIDNDALSQPLRDDATTRAPNGMLWPPCIIIERGESLDEWARRETPDFITVMQARCRTVPAGPSTLYVIWHIMQCIPY